MRIALIADIHGNFNALEAVLAHVSARKPDLVYHLGDLVGYGPAPNACVDRIRREAIPGISGNYDSAIAADHRPRPEDEQASLIFDWTQRELTPGNRRFLAGLPFRLDIRPEGGHRAGRTIFLVHGTPTLNTVAWWSHLDDSFHLEQAALLGARAGDVICAGHIHRPWYRTLEGIHFVSVGSVGRPKDGDPRACYVTLELDEYVGVEHHRVEYDIEGVAANIESVGLPADLGDFLRTAGA